MARKRVVRSNVKLQTSPEANNHVGKTLNSKQIYNGSLSINFLHVYVINDAVQRV